MKKHRFNAAFFFTLITFITMVTSASAIGALFLFSHRVGIIRNPNPFSLLLAFGVSSTLLGSFVSHRRIFGGPLINSVNKINQAMKAIANGNLKIRLDENEEPIEEVQTMKKNFNIMAQELENTEIFREDFIRNVSHEIKTPLSTIEGYATLLQNDHLDDKTRHEYTQKILQNTKRLSALTSNILLLSKLENREIPYDFKIFSLDEQIRQCILSLETLWEQKNIEFELDLETISYDGNENLLSHVWTNIIANAIKFSYDHQTIEISLHQEKDNIIVTIKDYGVGMSEDVQKRIFEKFYQGDTSHKSAGNGLGLTLASRVVSIHKGTIEVISQQNQGTTFIITLPITSH